MIRRPPRSTLSSSSAASDVYKRQHVVGVSIHGFKYFKQFLGPVWWLIPLMLPIEIISHLSRPLSLTFRLFGNIAGEDIVLAVVLLLVSLIHISEPTRLLSISYAVFCLKKKKK